MSLSLRNQILILTSGMVLVTIIALVLLAVFQTREQLHTGVERRSVSLATIVAESAAHALDRNDSSYLAHIAANVFHDPDVFGLRIYDSSGRLDFQKSTTDAPLLARIPFTASDSLMVDNRRDYSIVTIPVRTSSRNCGHLQLLISQASTTAGLRDSVVVIGLGSLLAFGFAIAIGISVSRKIVRPVQLFETAAERMSRGDLDVDLDIDDLQQDFVSLGVSFNEMRLSLKNAFAQLRKSREQLEQRVEERTRELRHELQERRKAESALRESTQLLHSTIEASGDGILVVDNEGRVTHSNGRFAELWRLPPDLINAGDDDKLLAYVLSQLVDPDAFLNKVKELYRSERIDFDTLEFKDGRFFERCTFPLLNNDHIAGRVWNFRDTTEQRHSDEQKRRLQRELDRAKRIESLGLLAGGVAHDLNNMLGPLVGYPSLILEELGPNHPCASYIEQMSVAAERSANVIQDLLTLARRGRYQMKPIDLNHIVSDYLSSPVFEKLQKARPGVKVDVAASSERLLLMGSAPHLSKTVMNLVSNAFDAISADGRITISTNKLQLEKLPGGFSRIEPGHYVTLHVSDTGTGIDEADMSRIFEPYYSKKEMGSSGSGLGLSVVRGVVKDHGGYYDVFSSPGKGTEFVLYFPATDKLSSEAKPDAEVTGGVESILVIDDDPGQRELASVLLESLGYRVATATDGRDGVEYLKNSSVDLVVLDMVMEPDMDGLDTYREIIELHPGQKAMIVSGYATSDRIAKALKLGVSGAIKKPFTRATLGYAIRIALDRTAHSGTTQAVAPSPTNSSP